MRRGTLVLAVATGLALAGQAAAAVQFGAPLRYRAGADPRETATADFDGDGRLDLAVANYRSDDLTVLTGAPGGGFGLARTMSLRPYHGPSSVATADFDVDGRSDLVVTTLYGPGELRFGAVLVLRGRGNGSFARPRAIALDPAVDGPGAVVVSDLNLDRRPDVAVANYFGESVSILLGRGGARFRAPVRYRANDGPIDLAVGDLDGDRRPDIAVAGNGVNAGTPGDLSVLRNRGGGRFGRPVSRRVGKAPSAVAIADLDGDGRPDLAVASSRSNRVSILPGRGDGSFGRAASQPVGRFPVAIAAADVDGDGRTDLAVADEDSADVAVLLNDGTLAFATTRLPAGGRLPFAVAVADVNGDARADLVVTSRTGYVAVLQGTL